MAKNQHNTNSSGGCVKLYKSSLSTIHHNSNSPQNSILVNTTALNPPLPTTKSTITTHVSSVKPASPQLPSSGEMIPIEFDPQLLLTLQDHDENSGKHQGSFQNTNQLAKVSAQEKKLKKQESMTDKFSSYINRVKNRMRTASDIGGAKISSGSDDLDENVSSYIGRAKTKIKSTSSTAGGGKSVSFI